MEDRTALEQRLQLAQRVLALFEEQAAGFGALHIPAHLKVELEEKRKEVQSLEERLAQLGGQREAIVNNLPNRPPIFVGRQAEIARCLEALSPDDRGWGVTIDGIGGMGKTALALEVAQRASAQAWFDAYLYVSAKTSWLSPDGVHEETLVHSSLDAFVREFARLLGNAELAHITDATARRATLLDKLSGRRTLLIWDNLETLTQEERGLIAEFLRKLPSANKAIITSRRRTGESALTIRLDRLAFEEANELMNSVGQRQPRVAHQFAQSAPSIRMALYEAAGGSPLALHWTLGLVAQKGHSLPQALARLQDAARSADLYGFLFADAVRDLATSDRSVLAALSTFLTPAIATALVDVTGLVRTQVEVVLERLVTLSLVNDLDDGYYGLHPLTRVYVHTALTAETLAGVLSKEPAKSLDDAPLGGDISPELLKILVCPEDRGSLELVDDGKFLLNPRNGYKYPIRNGIPVMLIEEGKKYRKEPTKWLDDAPLGGDISPELLKILVCPEDKGSLELADDGKFLLNPRNGYKYPIRNGIPVMLIEEGKKYRDARVARH